MLFQFHTMRLVDRLSATFRQYNLTYSSLSAIPLLTASVFIASIGLRATIFVIIALPLTLCVIYYRSVVLCDTKQATSKFFIIWTIWSMAFMYILFQNCIPVYELLPIENFIFIASFTVTGVLFFKTHLNATTHKNSHAGDGSSYNNHDEVQLLVGESRDVERDGGDLLHCGVCQKKMQPRSYHCGRCQVCVPEYEYHNVWLDCCIGAKNRKFFLAALALAIWTALWDANLSLTAICRPVLFCDIFGLNILMPEDCSDVYDQQDLSLCFISAVYCLVVAALLLLVLSYQLFLKCRGMTALEWRYGTGNRYAASQSKRKELNTTI